MNLVPEKRLDKNGKLVTRNVRQGVSLSKPSSTLPAPSASTKKSSGKRPSTSPKLRPHQISQELYTSSLHLSLVSPQLLAGDAVLTDTTVNFRVNQVEMFDVLSVAQHPDALYMLNEGVRTKDEAIQYMRDRGMEPPFDRSKLVQKALSRDISPNQYQSFFVAANVSTINVESPYLVDAIELFDSITLTPQYHDVAKLICDGEVRLTDIKKIGPARLKGYYRLRDTIPAFKALRKPDCAFTHDDIKNLLGRVTSPAKDSAGYKNDYEAAIRYLVRYGPEFIESAKLNELSYLDKKFGFTGIDGMDRAKYHLHFVDGPLKSSDVDILFKEGVDPVKAIELAGTGMSVNAILGVVEKEIPSSIGGGWL